MPSRSTDASIAFSVTDNLSQSVVKMKNALNEFKTDAEGLQQRLTALENTRLQLKNIDLKQARDQVEQARKAMETLGQAATDAEREALSGQESLFGIAAPAKKKAEETRALSVKKTAGERSQKPTRRAALRC